MTITSKEKAQEKLGNRRGVIGLDPYAKGVFERADGYDEHDPVTIAKGVVETVLTTTNTSIKMELWSALKERLESEMIMLPTEMWDNIFADDDIGPTLNGYAKMPKEFYYDENRHSFIIGVDEHKAKDPFDDASPL